MVFDLPGRLDFHLTRRVGGSQVRLTGNGTLGAAPAMPRNVLGRHPQRWRADSRVAGTLARTWRLGNRLVVDVFGPAVAASAPSAPVQASVPAPRSGSAAARSRRTFACPAVPLCPLLFRRRPSAAAPSTGPAKPGPQPAAPKCSRRRRLHPWRARRDCGCPQSLFGGSPESGAPRQ